ncbi:MAG: TOBE domain-containing protein [Syntrophomonadaceae bacterium]|nr:TOBE domain-containing protein [Syntrophomonadaceae bacterium]
MRISDPNKLIGKVMEIKDGQGMTEIIVDVGDRPVMATITPGAAEALGLQQGDEVFVMFNSTDVTLIKDTKEPRRDYGV